MQQKLYTGIMFHLARTRREEINYEGSWKISWTLFSSIGNHVKPAKERTRPPLRCFAYQNESECVYMCNLIVLRGKQKDIMYTSTFHWKVKYCG